MKTIKCPSGFVLGLLWLLIADVATAGSYTLFVGKGIEVCEAYLKNLNSFPKHPPMVCDRPLNPKFTEISRPKWQPLEFWPNRHLLRQAIRNKPFYAKYSDDEFEKVEPREKWEANLKAGMAAQTMTFGLASLDVDRDGTPETVLRFDTGFRCDPTNESTFANPGSSIEYYVLSTDQQQIDRTKTELTFPIAGGRPDLFLFRGQVYATSWVGNLGFQDGMIYVDTPFVTKPIPMPALRPCHYKFGGASTRRQPS